MKNLKFLFILLIVSLLAATGMTPLGSIPVAYAEATIGENASYDEFAAALDAEASAEADAARARLLAKYGEAVADDNSHLVAKGQSAIPVTAYVALASWTWTYFDKGTGLSDTVFEMLGLSPGDPSMGDVLDSMTSQLGALRSEIDKLSRLIEQVLDGQALSDFRMAQSNSDGEIGVIESDSKMMQFFIEYGLAVTPDDARDLRISTYQALSRLEPYVNGEAGAVPLAAAAISAFDGPVSTLRESYWGVLDEYRDTYKRAMLAALATLSYADDIELSASSEAALAVKTEDVADSIQWMYESTGIGHAHGIYMHTEGSQAAIASFGSMSQRDWWSSTDDWQGMQSRFYASTMNANPVFWATFLFETELETARDAFVASAASDSQTFEQWLRSSGLPTAYAGTHSVSSGYLLDAPEVECNSNASSCRGTWNVVTVNGDSLTKDVHRTGWVGGSWPRSGATAATRDARDAWNIENSGRVWMVVKRANDHPLNEAGRLTDWNTGALRDAARAS